MFSIGKSTLTAFYAKIISLLILSSIPDSSTLTPQLSYIIYKLLRDKSSMVKLIVFCLLTSIVKLVSTSIIESKAKTSISDV
jgi:hypothetical protein